MIILRTVKNFSSLNIAASILLFLMAILAAVIANSPMAPLYQGFLLQELHLRIGDFNLFSHGGHPLKMIEFINDCLMTVFFLAVGLEIKRELLVGELSSFRKASLPFVAACGGMLIGSVPTDEALENANMIAGSISLKKVRGLIPPIVFTAKE